jgi:predicted acetyltransferase
MLASAADHAEIQDFLEQVFPQYARSEFLSSLDDPFYEPRDRLLLKDAGRVVAHVHLTRRVMELEGVRLPISGVAGLAILPEYRGRGLARALLRAAQRYMLRDRSLLGMLRTSIPRFFRTEGWAVCGRHSQARAGVRLLLAQLASAGVQPCQPGLRIRPWRQMELAGLQRVYDSNAATAAGPLVRTEAYWRWLVSRQAYDQIYVAVGEAESADPCDPTAPAAYGSEGRRGGGPIHGYCILKHHQIVELMALPGRTRVAQALLAHACSEIVEQDFDVVELHAAPDDPLLEHFRRAGGSIYLHEVSQGEVYMMKVLNAPALLRALAPRFVARAAPLRPWKPAAIGFHVNGQKLRLLLTRGGVRVGHNKTGRHYLSVSDTDFTRLLVGHLSLAETIEAGRARCSTRLAQQVGLALLPRLPLWRPPLDELRA